MFSEVMLSVDVTRISFIMCKANDIADITFSFNRSWESDKISLNGKANEPYNNMDLSICLLYPLYWINTTHQEQDNIAFFDSFTLA